MKVVIASHNPGKIRELQTMLQSLPIELISATDAGVADVEETAVTFVENALLKARHACEQTGMPSLADDSGIAVDALNGAPGIYSARWANAKGDAEKNNLKLLDAIKDVPETLRTASFHCVLVFMLHASDPTPLICHGVWHGIIAAAILGAHGFGYDPVFFIPELKLTAAELTAEHKNRISHRGQAFQLLLQQLPKKLQQNSGSSYART